MDNDVFSSVGTALLESGFRLLKDVVWVKPFPPAPHFHPFHRTDAQGGQSRKGAKTGHFSHCQDMRREARGKQVKPVWRLSSPGRAVKSFGKHPTQKAAALVDRCLRASANVEDLVLDPCAGSNATGVAARRIGLIFIGVDNQPDYLAIAVSGSGTLTPPMPGQRACHRRRDRFTSAYSRREISSLNGGAAGIFKNPSACRQGVVFSRRPAPGHGSQTRRKRGLNDQHRLGRSCRGRYLGIPLNSSGTPNLDSWELKVIPLMRSCN